MSLSYDFVSSVLQRIKCFDFDNQMMIKFAVQIEAQFGYNWSQIRDIAEKTEAGGYHAFYTCDHFFLDDKSANRYSLEAYSILSAVAAITDRINLGSLVTGNNYRNPALLAKIAASVDEISGGRMELGIGAGWKELEYKAYGYDFPSVLERMDRLEESLQIIKKLFTEESPSFTGKYYQLENAHFSPRPKNPFILIGGGGEKRTLKLVAKYADYCNLFSWIPTKDIIRKLNVLKEHCHSIGRDYDDVGKSLFTPMKVMHSEDELNEFVIHTAKRNKISVDVMRSRLMPEDTPGSWFGTPEMIRERIDYFNSLGFDYYFFQQGIDLSSDNVTNFAEYVLKYY